MFITVLGLMKVPLAPSGELWLDDLYQTYHGEGISSASCMKSAEFTLYLLFVSGFLDKPSSI